MELLFLQQLAGMSTEKEACTKFFFINLEKRKQVKKHIRKLVISGAITTDPYQILSEEKNFYYNLYKTKAVDKDSIKSFLNNLNIPQLSEEQKLSCEGQITVEECKSLQEMTESQFNPIKTAEIL